jgi:hypothetical protein
MTTTTFELVRSVLDEMYPALEKEHGANVGKAIRERSDQLSKQYGKLDSGKREPIDYSSSLTRFAYVYMYVTAHASWAAGLLAVSPDLVKLLKNNSLLHATFLGGGPGSELIGLLKAAQAAKRKAGLSCFLLDYEDGWAETWADVDQKVNADFKLTTMVRKVDVCNPPKPENIVKASNADMFFAIFFLSEIHSFADKCGTFFDNLVGTMKSGAYVVCIDNAVPAFINFGKQLFPAKYFELLHEDKSMALRISPNEEKKALGPYLDIVSKQPRLSTDAAARLIWRKK